MACFAAAFLIHVALWRFHVPRPDTVVLLTVFFGTLPLGLGTAAWLLDWTRNS